MDLTVKGNIAILNIGSNENRICLEFIKNINRLLDQAENDDEVGCLICTANGKFFCNGVDLQSLMTQSAEDFSSFWREFCTLLLRILCFPMPTISALNGHAFAGGCFLALAFDYRVMNSDKGWMSLNEVYLPARFPEFLTHFIREVVPQGSIMTQLVTLGKRFTAKDALDSGLIQATAPVSQLMDKAYDIAKERLRLGNLQRDACKNLKRDLHKNLILQVDKVDYPSQPDLPKSRF